MDLEEAHNLIKKWLFPITDDDKLTIKRIFTGTENSIGIHFLRKYIQLIKPYCKVLGISENTIPREADCLASGVVFFYGCLFYIIHFPNWGSHIKDIFLYNLLYILVDHYIDDINLDPNIKSGSIFQMSILILDPLSYKTMSLNDPILEVIANIYYQLITNCPKVKEVIIKLFQSEIEGLDIQNNPNLSREQYYNIATKKGKYTMLVLQAIVDNDDATISEASCQLGEIMQKIDDSLDVLSDKENGIYTIATHDLDKKGILDELWIDITKQIDSIDSQFNIFKILYGIFAMYIPDRLPKNYSTQLRMLTSPLNLFEVDGSSLLVETIMSELQK